MAKQDPTVLYFPSDEGRTQQNFKDETDINNIVKRAAQGGLIPGRDPNSRMYGDFTNIPSYQDAFEIVKRSEALFMELPWDVRERFANDPQKMVMFLQDPKNREEAVKLGLVKAPELAKVDESLETLKSIDSSLKARSGAKKGSPKDDD